MNKVDSTLYDAIKDILPGRPALQDRELAKQNVVESKRRYNEKNQKVCEICKPVFGERVQRNMSTHVKTKIHQRMLDLSQNN